jgi:hypothetical protein
MDAALRMLVGLIGAGVLVAMMHAGMVNVKFGLPAPSPGADAGKPASAPGAKPDCGVADCSDQAWLEVLIFGFVAGFSERFVPDLLAKASPTAPTPGPAPAKAPPAPSSAAGTPAGKKPEDATDAAPPGQKPGDPAHDDEAHDDNCACDTPLDEAEATADEHLPAASGGVATPNPA